MLVIVVQEIFIDLVGDNEQVVANREVGYELKLITREYLSRWIAWSVENDCSRLVRDRLLTLLATKYPSRWMHGHIHRNAIESLQRVYVITVVRLEDDDFISGIE